uniref:type IV secretory system conjugative DNA transfer family protein n=1 Tax=Lactococcus sp. TaxID=44273 RepID=UPI003242FB38
MKFSDGVGISEIKKKNLKQGTLKPKAKPKAKVKAKSALKTKVVEMFDEALAEELLIIGGVTPKVVKKNGIKKFFSPKKMEYNPIYEKVPLVSGRNKYKSLSDYINDCWYADPRETGRAVGAYICATFDCNNIIFGMTRSGKGQTMVNPKVDLLSRASKMPNQIILDPKGFEARKYTYMLMSRGAEVLQFNLLEPSKSDVFNSLMDAYLAFKDDDLSSGASYVTALASTVFPTNSNDPMWSDSAANMLKRSTYILISYVLSETKRIRRLWLSKGRSNEAIAKEIDRIEGYVNPYCVYQMITILAGSISYDPDEINLADDSVEKEKDRLSLLFDALSLSYSDPVVQLALNAHEALKQTSGSGKTMASIYTTTLTGLSFFADPTIKAITTGSPSEHFDIGSLNFQRRIKVKFSLPYMKTIEPNNTLTHWSMYEDKNFTKKMDPKLFDYDGHVDSNTGICQYVFEGKLEKRIGYAKLELSSKEFEKYDEFFFEIKVEYKINRSNMSYYVNTVTNEKEVKDGFVTELKRTSHGFVEENSTVLYDDLILVDAEAERFSKLKRFKRIFEFESLRYTEKAKVVFVIAPPNKSIYQGIILSILTQIIDKNLEESYKIRPSGEPDVPTYYEFDEFGNLLYNGKGLVKLPTYMSIGLEQKQIISLYLQVIQQLREAIGGESAEKTVFANTNNITFISNTDLELVNMLSELSGTAHKTFNSSYTETIDQFAPAFKSSNVGNRSISVEQQNLITKNTLLNMKQQGHIGANATFMASSAPILNKNERIFPMSWKLHEKIPQDKNGSYSLSTLPSNRSSVINFDRYVLNPFVLLDNVMSRHKSSKQIKKEFLRVFNLTEREYLALDTKEIGYFSSIMNDLLNENKTNSNSGKKIPTVEKMQEWVSSFMDESNSSNERQKSWAHIHYWMRTLKIPEHPKSIDGQYSDRDIPELKSKYEDFYEEHKDFVVPAFNYLENEIDFESEKRYVKKYEKTFLDTEILLGDFYNPFYSVEPSVYVSTMVKLAFYTLKDRINGQVFAGEVFKVTEKDELYYGETCFIENVQSENQKISRVIDERNEGIQFDYELESQEILEKIQKINSYKNLHVKLDFTKFLIQKWGNQLNAEVLMSGQFLDKMMQAKKLLDEKD